MKIHELVLTHPRLLHRQRFMRHLRRDNVLGLHQTRRIKATELTASGLEDDGVTFALPCMCHYIFQAPSCIIQYLCKGRSFGMRSMLKLTMPLRHPRISNFHQGCLTTRTPFSGFGFASPQQQSRLRKNPSKVMVGPTVPSLVLYSTDRHRHKMHLRAGTALATGHFTSSSYNHLLPASFCGPAIQLLIT
jgi:hypothetical protein